MPVTLVVIAAVVVSCDGVSFFSGGDEPEKEMVKVLSRIYFPGDSDPLVVTQIAAFADADGQKKGYPAAFSCNNGTVTMGPAYYEEDGVLFEIKKKDGIETVVAKIEGGRMTEISGTTWKLSYDKGGLVSKIDDNTLIGWADGDLAYRLANTLISDKNSSGGGISEQTSIQSSVSYDDSSPLDNHRLSLLLLAEDKRSFAILQLLCAFHANGIKPLSLAGKHLPGQVM
jgi:hypothetical protein